MLHLRDQEKQEAGRTFDQSCSEPSERTFLRDYSGKELASFEDAETAQTAEEFAQNAPKEDADANVELVDHILDRLVTMLMIPTANSDQDFIAEDYQIGDEDPNYESLLMQKIRLSGQAKSVRCLSSHIR